MGCNREKVGINKIIIIKCIPIHSQIRESALKWLSRNDVERGSSRILFSDTDDKQEDIISLNATMTSEGRLSDNQKSTSDINMPNTYCGYKEHISKPDVCCLDGINRQQKNATESSDIRSWCRKRCFFWIPTTRMPSFWVPEREARIFEKAGYFFTV